MRHLQTYTRTFLFAGKWFVIRYCLCLLALTLVDPIHCPSFTSAQFKCTTHKATVPAKAIFQVHSHPKPPQHRLRKAKQVISICQFEYDLKSCKANYVSWNTAVPLLPAAKGLTQNKMNSEFSWGVCCTVSGSASFFSCPKSAEGKERSKGHLMDAAIFRYAYQQRGEFQNHSTPSFQKRVQ